MDIEDIQQLQEEHEDLKAKYNFLWDEYCECYNAFVQYRRKNKQTPTLINPICEKTRPFTIKKEELLQKTIDENRHFRREIDLLQRELNSLKRENKRLISAI